MTVLIHERIHSCRSWISSTARHSMTPRHPLFPSGRPLAVRCFTVRWVKHSAIWWNKLMDMHSELWELMRSPKENLWEQRAGKYAHHTHATVATNVTDGAIMWDRTIHGHFGVVDYLFISSISRCRSVICQSYHLNWTCWDPFQPANWHAAELFEAAWVVPIKKVDLTMGKRNQADTQTIPTYITCLRLIPGGVPSVMFVGL